MPGKSNFLDKVLGRLARLDSEGLQTVVQRLARERTLLETVFNAIEDGVLVLDEGGRVLYFNQAVTRLVGLQPNVEGQPLTEVLPELDWAKVAKLDAEGGPSVARHEFEVHYPRPRFLRVYAAPLDREAPGAVGVALILHDITEARQETFEAIESERIQALTLLAASVAHEIGNPLNALHIHLQLMQRQARNLKELSSVEVQSKSPGLLRRRRRGAIATEAKPEIEEIVARLEEFLAVAKGEVQRLDYIVTQFLQAIRPAPPQFRAASLNEVAQKTLDLLAPELRDRGIDVQKRLARQLPAAPIDPVQIQQVLVNLVRNAMQAMTRGGTLTVQTSEGSDGLWVIVADTGRGIPQEQINRIFDPFYTTKRKGTGLGLMIVQRIVRAHRGKIELESQVGRGTTFRIWLPLHEPRPRLLGAPGEAAPAAPQPPG